MNPMAAMAGMLTQAPIRLTPAKPVKTHRPLSQALCAEAASKAVDRAWSLSAGVNLNATTHELVQEAATALMREAFNAQHPGSDYDAMCRQGWIEARWLELPSLPSVIVHGSADALGPDGVRRIFEAARVVDMRPTHIAVLRDELPHLLAELGTVERVTREFPWMRRFFHKVPRVPENEGGRCFAAEKKTFVPRCHRVRAAWRALTGEM